MRVIRASPRPAGRVRQVRPRPRQPWRRPLRGAWRCAPDRSGVRPLEGRAVPARPRSRPARRCSRTPRQGGAGNRRPRLSVPVRCRAASRTAPRSAPAGQPPAPCVRACGSSEKIPPPSLSTSTTSRSSLCSRAVTSAPRSCRKERSPTTRTTGPIETAAEPSAVEATPSMPLAPRLASTLRVRSPAGSQASISRTGMELPAHSTAPSGSSRPRALNGAPSKGSSSPSSQAASAQSAAASATSQSSAQPVPPPLPAATLPKAPLPPAPLPPASLPEPPASAAASAPAAWAASA